VIIHNLLVGDKHVGLVTKCQQSNVAFLEENDYKYILAYKIKNIDNELKEKIANLTFFNDKTIHTLKLQKEIQYKDNNGKKQTLHTKQRLILSYSTKRAKKDNKTREKAIEKIKAKLSKNITKSDLKYHIMQNIWISMINVLSNINLIQKKFSYSLFINIS